MNTKQEIQQLKKISIRRAVFKERNLVYLAIRPLTSMLNQSRKEYQPGGTAKISNVLYIYDENLSHIKMRFGGKWKEKQGIQVNPEQGYETMNNASLFDIRK